MSQLKSLVTVLSHVEQAIEKGKHSPLELKSILNDLEEYTPERLDALRTTISNLVDKDALDSDRSSSSRPSEGSHTISNFQTIDWKSELSDLPTPNREYGRDGENATPAAVRALDAWIAQEALSPSTYSNPEQLATGDSEILALGATTPWSATVGEYGDKVPFFTVYLGSIDLNAATNALIDRYSDRRAERPDAKNMATIGALILDAEGRPLSDNPFALSSFPWALGQAAQGRLSTLRHWKYAEQIILRELTKMISDWSSEHSNNPITLEHINALHTWFLDCCQVPHKLASGPSFAVRTLVSKDQDPPSAPLLNSPFIEDLESAAVLFQSGKPSRALQRYFTEVSPEEQTDLLKDTETIISALRPGQMPAARWPGSGRHNLCLMQQVAVNLSRHSLADGGIFSINGPPGTGKTTLLRDIIAGAICDRAKAMIKFDDPETAFAYKGKVEAGGWNTFLYELDNSIRGHEVLVASSSNKALENICHELPLRSQIDCEEGSPSFFQGAADKLLGDIDSCWGLVAAPLGRSANRKAYRDAVWTDKGVGLRSYLWAIRDEEEAGESGDSFKKKEASLNERPKSRQEALDRWEAARNKFAAVIQAFEEKQAACNKAYVKQIGLEKLVSDLEKKASDVESLEAKQREWQKKRSSQYQELPELERKQVHAEDTLKVCQMEKPGFLRRIFSPRSWQKWQNDIRKDKKRAERAEWECERLRDEIRDSRGRLMHIQRQIEDLNNRIQQDTNKVSEAKNELSSYLDVTGDRLVTKSFEQKNHRDQQLVEPTFSDKVHRIRDRVFWAAIEVHKAFVDAAAKPMRQNLSAYFSSYNRDFLSNDQQHMIDHLWSSLSLITPVVSTTFSSARRMLHGVSDEAIGWLLVDEAGQASPQDAIGTIMRAKRTLVVGDPLQIPPVVTLPDRLLEMLANEHGLEGSLWAGPQASVQRMADRGNRFGTQLDTPQGNMWIGTPLLVHRRCQNPMFRICNEMAYSGLMVQKLIKPTHPLAEKLGPSVWVDIKSDQSQEAPNAPEKWSSSESRFVRSVLCRALESDPKASICVISPFKDVVNELSKEIRQEPLFQQLFNKRIDRWLGDHVGTVHTFQGQEAEVVILLLGAPLSKSRKSRKWATDQINILNVAVSRAKGALYVVGNREIWGASYNMTFLRENLDRCTADEFFDRV